MNIQENLVYNDDDLYVDEFFKIKKRPVLKGIKKLFYIKIEKFGNI